MEQKSYSPLIVKGEKLMNSKKYKEAIEVLEEAFELILEKKRIGELNQKQLETLLWREHQCANWLLLSYIRAKKYNGIAEVLEPYLQEENENIESFDYQQLNEFYFYTRQFDKARKIIDKLVYSYINILFEYSPEDMNTFKMDRYSEMMSEYCTLTIDRAELFENRSKIESEKEAADLLSNEVEKLLERVRNFYAQYEEIIVPVTEGLYENILIYDLADERGYAQKLKAVCRHLLQCHDVIVEKDLLEIYEADLEDDNDVEILISEEDELYDNIDDMIKMLELAYALKDENAKNIMGGVFWETVKRKFSNGKNNGNESAVIKKYINDSPTDMLKNYCYLVIYFSCMGNLEMAEQYILYISPELSNIARCAYTCKFCECYRRYEALGMYYYACDDREKAMEYFAKCVQMGSRDGVANFMVNRKD